MFAQRASADSTMPKIFKPKPKTAVASPTPLTDEQIDALFQFVKSKYVDFYDVQVELVDHLASEVETRIAETPSVTFDAALQQVYRGFGIFGFSDLVEEKQNAADKRVRVLWMECVGKLFRLPFLAGSVLLGILLFVMFDYFGSKFFIQFNAGVALLAIISSVIYFLKNRPQKGFKLTTLQYNAILHFWHTAHFNTIFLVTKWLKEGYSYEIYSVLIPLLCWVSWVGFTANMLGFKKLAEESRKQFPLAFA